MTSKVFFVVELVGGPLDGARRIIDPAVTELWVPAGAAPLFGFEDEYGPPPAPRAHVYRRRSYFDLFRYVGRA